MRVVTFGPRRKMLIGLRGEIDGLEGEKIPESGEGWGDFRMNPPNGNLCLAELFTTSDFN